MNSKVLALLAVFALVSAVGAWQDDEYSGWRLARASRRSHHCIGSGSKCFSTTECCRGFVCAAFDDYFGRSQRSEGMNPEIPGFCVKEKDLQPCFSSRDCDARLKCANLGREGEQYCVSRPNIAAHDIIDDLPIINVPSSANQMRFESEGKAGLGAICETNDDCKAVDKIGGSQLCCQDVQRGRQGTKRMCDRQTRRSKCIAR